MINLTPVLCTIAVHRYAIKFVPKIAGDPVPKGEGWEAFAHTCSMERTYAWLARKGLCLFVARARSRSLSLSLTHTLSLPLCLSQSVYIFVSIQKATADKRMRSVPPDQPCMCVWVCGRVSACLRVYIGRILSLGMNCKFLTRLYASFQTEASLCFVMGVAPGGELLYHIQQQAALGNNSVIGFGEERTRLYVLLKSIVVLVHAERM